MATGASTFNVMTKAPIPMEAPATSLALPSQADLLGNESKPSKLPVPTGWEANRRWVTLAITTIGSLLAAIQSSALIVALPTLIENLHTTLGTIMWVLLSFMLAITCIVGIIGKLGDKIGRARLFNIGYGIFTLGCFLAGFSQPNANGYDLIAYRCVMGIGAALVFSNSAAIVADAFAPFNQVGIGEGINAMAFATGSVFGPVIGGALSNDQWSWIFWLNVPFGALCVIAGSFLIRDKPRNKKRSLKSSAVHLIKRLDWVAVFLTLASLVLLLLALSQVVYPDPVLSKTKAVVPMVVIGAVGLAVMFYNEVKWAKDPLFDLPAFKNKAYAAGQFNNLLASFARGNVNFGLIFYLQGPYGVDPLTAGIMLIPMGIGMILTGFIAGRIADKFGSRLLCISGPLISAIGSIGFFFMSPETNYWLIAFALFIFGIGMGIYNSPNAMIVMMSVEPKKRGEAAAIRMLTTMLSQMLAIVMCFGLVLTSVPFDLLLHVFIVGGGLDESNSASFTQKIHIVVGITIAVLVLIAVSSGFMPNRITVPGGGHGHGEPAPAIELEDKKEVKAEENVDVEKQEDKEDDEDDNVNDPVISGEGAANAAVEIGI